MAERKQKRNKAILLANPRGFCAGVCRALSTVEAVLSRFGSPVYVKHQIVHNDFVVDDLRSRGVKFIEDLDELPCGRPLIVSAHGVPPDFFSRCEACGISVIDATCPLVKKVHREAMLAGTAGMTVLLIGHSGHPEIMGTIGYAGDTVYVLESADDVNDLPDLDSSRVVILTQTTLTKVDILDILAALESRFPGMPPGDDICYATQNRQDAVRRMASECDLILVVGSASSSNSRRLCEEAERAGVAACLINCFADVPAGFLPEFGVIGITAGASAPESLVLDLISELAAVGWQDVRELPGPEEMLNFQIPEIPSVVED